MLTRYCRKHKINGINEFIKAGLNKSGSQRYKCRLCQKELRKNNYQKNKDKINLKNKTWKKNNPEKSKELNKKYRKKFVDSFIEKKMIYEELKPKTLRAAKRLIGCILELNRIERNGNKKC